MVVIKIGFPGIATKETLEGAFNYVDAFADGPFLAINAIIKIRGSQTGDIYYTKTLSAADQYRKQYLLDSRADKVEGFRIVLSSRDYNEVAQALLAADPYKKGLDIELETERLIIA